MPKIVVNASGGNLVSHASNNGTGVVITTTAKHADGTSEKDTRS